MIRYLNELSKGRYDETFAGEDNVPCQLIKFANSLDPVQYQQNVGSDLDTDHLAL